MKIGQDLAKKQLILVGKFYKKLRGILLSINTKSKEKNIIEDMLYELKKHEIAIDKFEIPDVTKFNKLKKDLGY